MGSSQDIAGDWSGSNGYLRWSEREPESRVPVPRVGGAVLRLNAGRSIFSALAWLRSHAVFATAAVAANEIAA